MNITNNKIWICFFALLASFLMLAIVAEGQKVRKGANSLDNSKAISSVASLSTPVDAVPTFSFSFKEVPLKDALQEVAEKGRMKLLFNHSLVLTDDNKLTMELRNVNLREAFEQTLSQSNLDFIVSGNGYIIIVPKLVTQTINVQQEDISGTVSDAQSGDPLPGVNVLLKGTTTGTSTESDGNFELTVPSLQDTLIFSFIGYQTQEVPLNGRSTLEINLQPQAIAGDEVVVTAFGLERETQSLTYSTQSVENEQLTEARELNVVNSLSGEVAGLQINQAGTGVGGSSRVVLRGNRSITGSSQPLYVVDGVPIRGEVSDLNPDNIQSMNVLKGPNAAALYGSAAQNGAIVITTKKGQQGEVDFSLSSNFMFRDPILLTDYQNQYGQGNGGVYSASSEFNYGPEMNGQMVEHWSPNPENDSQEYEFLPQPNNVSDAFQTGYNSSTNLSASMGSENVQALFSYTFTDAEGVVPNNALERHNISARVNSQLTDKLSLDSKLSYMRQVIDNELPTGENFANPIRHIYRMPRNVRTADAKVFEYTNVSGANRQHFWNPGSNGGANPYWTMNRNLNENTRNRVIALASLTYDFTDYLRLMVRASYDGENGEYNIKRYNDTYIIADNGYYEIGQSSGLEWNGDFLLSYDQDLTQDWSLEANVGGNIKQQRNSAINSNTNNALTIPNFFTISNTQNVVSNESVGSPVDVYSLYAFGQIAWQDAIFLDVTGRNDWSSTLPADNRSYFYPSVGLSTDLTELIPELPELFSYAQLRGSWAKVGNSAPPFMTQRTASLSAGGNNGFLQLSTTLPNERLKPEETESFEVGLDLRFLDDRLGLDVTYYNTHTRDQLFQVAVPVGSGASSFFTNGGDVSNKGYEVLLSATPVQTPDFNWDLKMNFSANENMVEEISEDQPRLTITTDFLRAFRIEEGEPYGQVYSRGFERVTKEDSEHFGKVIVGSDGIPEITSGLTVPVANFTPDWRGGIRSTFSYKNLSLSFLIDHRQGGSVVSLTNAILYYNGLTTQTLQGRDGGLVFGDNIFGGEPAVVQTGGTEDDPVYSENTTSINAEQLWTSIGGRNTPVGEAFVEDATNTRLRELKIGYSLPQSMIGRLPISGLKISLVGRNLLFLHRASNNIDPDLMTGTNAAAEGFESFTPPSSRTFGANINIDF
ncbi:SusC/RagA family TonB-linked outer membrane protein [Fodinibius salsisoli]|uniref:SusC/RagA family TonB-linked outer membrane protein n=1 Tax=Fodinibius salsisoli TaxID=2820877 RepID=A0ABT3PPZ0_9BACT|nr:SusC/RagA family TonB-linked outer membrane protein [Fodinibius salsisoli]MCW9707923.1 SusC/RagA family TonB-linked outer membrane protein [Fodinibius salsisoli]